MAKISAKKRLQDIVALLEKEGYVSGQKLAEKYHVSMETIRKDLTYLEKIGVADKEYGGATLASVNIERPMEYRLDKQEEKDAIARYAVSLIKGLHTLFLDSGSTCLACVPYEKFQEKGFHTYTDWENVDGLITSPELSGKKYVEFSKKVQVMVSDKEVNQ